MADNGVQPGATGDVRLTYQELGARLRISAEAARTLTRRRGWRRLAPNRKGAPATVVVPIEELDAEDWRPNRGAPLDGDRSPPDSRVDMAERRADMAEQRAVEADKRADAALVVADRTLAQLADANARADRAEARADRAGAEAERARDAVRQMEQAEAERKGRGRLRRAWEAWRGV
jgi:hypothetical protein